VPTYAVAGVVLDADLPLSGLTPTTATPPTWVIREGTVAPELDVEPVAELRTADGRRWGELLAGAGGYRLTYHDRVHFYVDFAARTVTYLPVGELPTVTLRHLLVDQLLPHLLAVGGDLVLHASAVELDGTALAFVGPTGAGKSSLAAGFVARGAALLTDDFVVLRERGDRYLAEPAYPSLRLWEDAAERFAGHPEELQEVADYTAKRRWDVPEAAHAREPVPLRAVIAPGLEPGPGDPPARIGRLGGSDSFAILLHQHFRVEGPGRRARQAADFDRIARLAGRVPVFLMEHRRDYALLEGALDTIVDAVAEL
jgi:hypothetical protein